MNKFLDLLAKVIKITLEVVAVMFIIVVIGLMAKYLNDKMPGVLFIISAFISIFIVVFSYNWACERLKNQRK